MLPEVIELTIIPVEPTVWDGHDRVDPELYRFTARERELIHRIVNSFSDLPARQVFCDPVQEDGTINISSPDYGADVNKFFEFVRQLTGQVDYTSSPVRMWLAQPDFISRVQFTQLRIVLVWLTRGEKFCGGFWAGRFNDETISRLVQRLSFLEAYQEHITMFKIDPTSLSLTPVPKTTLQELDMLERRDLQKLIKSSFENVAAAINEDNLILIGEEVVPSPVVSDRIDLLAVDGDDGDIVVIELKRAKHKLQLLQALSYAAMVSGRQIADLKTLAGIDSRKFDDLRVSKLTNCPRLILVAEDFDYQVLKTAEWLLTQSIEVKCVRLTVTKDEETNNRFLSFSVIFPPKGIEDEAKMKRLPKTEGTPSADWKEYVSHIGDQALKSFVETNLLNGRENQFAYKTFHYRFEGSRRFQVWIKQTSALVEQIGRFDGDVEFWKNRLPSEAQSHEVYGGERLRFYLRSAEDFSRFTAAAETELKSVAWKKNSSDLNC